MNIKKHIPNAITLGNLLCGCLAIVSAFEGNLVVSAYFVGIALILDFFDGFTARMLKVASPIGKDLDSLADMVTFGVVPGIVMFKMIHNTLPLLLKDGGWFIYPPDGSEPVYLCYFAFIITLFSCVRLAKFNNDTRQSESFIGLNTPSNSMVICSLPLILKFHPNLVSVAALIHNPLFLCILSLVLSILLVSEIPFFSLKFKNFGWADNSIRFVFLVLSLLILVTLQFAGIPVVILLYILLSIVNNIFLKKKV